MCEGDACEPDDELACAGLPLEGVCDGNVVRGCLEGWPFTVDCAELGKRCVIGDEGAGCRKPSAEDCEHFGTLPRCEGQKLLTCVAGERVVRDCAAMSARCEVLAHTGLASCVVASELARAPRDNEPCGPCGCLEGMPIFSDESCNGKDDDGDTWIDEDVSCEPLQVIAFVVTDSAGGSSYSAEDIEQEIASVDEVFSADHGGLRMHVALAGLVELPRPDYLSIEDDELGPLLAELRSNPSLASSQGLRVPIVFTDELASDDTPKAGLSTLPNGTCGGTRRTPFPQPLRGVIVVAKRRAPTTVAHELGHFLGLCHTHEADPEAVVRVARWRNRDGSGRESTCDAVCSLEGDGICDTPRDPGPESCTYDARCDVQCGSGDVPSARNLMSYYTSCRDQLTPIQTVELHRSRALLDGWYRCAEPSECPCLPDGVAAPADRIERIACPEQMSCRPTASGDFGCSLDGALLEGERCRAHAECGADLVCVEQRCANWPTP